MSADILSRTCRSVASLATLAGICCLLGACGFYLRGLQSTNVKPVWPAIQVDCPDTEKFFCNRLRDQLIQSGVEVIDVTPESRKRFTTAARSTDLGQSTDGEVKAQTDTADAYDLEGGNTPPAAGLTTTGNTAPETRERQLDPPLLHIIALGSNRRAVTLTSNAGAAEFEVSRAVNFEMTQAKETIIEDTTLRQFQTYRYDSESVLGKDREETQIRNDLDNLLAFQIVNRIAIEGIKSKEADNQDSVAAPTSYSTPQQGNAADAN